MREKNRGNLGGNILEEYWFSLVNGLANPIISKTLKKAERQSSGEKLSFESSQIDHRIEAEAELPPTGFLTLLQVGPQFPPTPIIAESELREQRRVAARF